MIGHLPAVRAEFLDLKLNRMVLFVAGGDVVLIAADGALQDDLVSLFSFCCHFRRLLNKRE